METHIEMRGNTAVFTGTARNQSGKPIRHAAWCVQTKKLKTGCSFSLWTTKTPWKPGEEIEFEYKAPAGHGFPNHLVSLIDLQLVTKFDPIQKIFLGSIQGTSGNLAREQLIALITNSGRFQVVEDQGAADATLTGIAEPRGEETFGSATTTDVMAGLRGLSVGSARGTSVTDSLRLVSDVVVLRLTLPTGEIVWAWDDTRPCDRSRTKCAFEDLLTAAR
jgi:hypothetical protein